MTRLLRSRVALAVLRAGFMSLLVVLPQVLLGHGTPGSRQLLALFALMAGLFTFSEYASRSPSLVEFRDARPYNRIRALSILSAVLLASVVLEGPRAGAALQVVQQAALACGSLLDLPYSRVQARADSDVRQTRGVATRASRCSTAVRPPMA